MARIQFSKIAGSVLASMLIVTAAFAVSPAAASGNSSYMSVDELIPVFAAPQKADDVVPNTVDLSKHGNVSLKSTRFLGIDDRASYWVGKNNAGEVCLVMQLSNADGMSAGSCVSAPRFQQTGIKMLAGLDQRDLSTAAEAYLIPGDIQVESLLGQNELLNTKSELTIYGQLLTVEPQTENLSRTVVTRKDGPSFVFEPLILSRLEVA